MLTLVVKFECEVQRFFVGASDAVSCYRPS